MAEYRIPNINRIFITGHLTSDAELKYTPDGKPVCSFQIANNRRYKIKDEWLESTTFVRVVSFGPPAERVSNLKKGDAVYVEGRLESREWTASNGEKKKSFSIVAVRLQKLTKLPEEKLEIEEEEGDEDKEVPPF